jgi:membrane protein DedA with SNARE-associated domain
MSAFEESIRDLLFQIAQNPHYLYLGVVIFLTLSSFGLPVPEEIVLVTSGAAANVAYLEAIEKGADPSINPITLAAVCFFAVFLSDFLVFTLGKKLGMKFLSLWPFSKFIKPNMLDKVMEWTQKYGAWACGFFRFTPGLRFPGHFMCGTLKIPTYKFVLFDGTAALVSVPTQVLLLAYYGEDILKYFQQFKIFLFSAFGLLVLFYLIKKFAFKAKA